MRRTIIFIAVSVALVMLGSALAGPGDTAPQTVSLSASAARVEYGDRVQLAGSIQPVAAAQEIVIEQLSGYGWTELARTTTDMSGAFDVDLVPVTTGSVRARVLPVGAVSDAVLLDVVPKVSIKPAHGRAFAGIKISARIAPSSYAARAVVLVKRDGKTVGRRTARVPPWTARDDDRHGRNRQILHRGSATGSIGAFGDGSGWAIGAQGRTLSSGSSGRDVRELMQRLAALRFHVPGIASTFSSYLTDSVIAFQKAYRLPGPASWARKPGASSRRQTSSSLATEALRCTSRSTRRGRSSWSFEETRSGRCSRCQRGRQGTHQRDVTRFAGRPSRRPPGWVRGSSTAR